MAPALLLATALTFSDAYARALAARGLNEAFASRVVPPPETHPAVRLELSEQRGQNIDLREGGVLNPDQSAALLSVDVPIVDRAARLRRTANAETDALLFRRHAIDEANALFDQTLDVFGQLVLAQRRLDLLGAAARRAGESREHVQTQLAAGRIDDLTAASWEEQLLSAETQAVDAELQRLDAEMRLKQLMGITDDVTFDAVADLDGAETPRTPTPGVDIATLNERKQQLLFDEVQAQRRPQLFVTGYGGAVAGSGIAGIRLSLSLPFYDATRVAEAKLRLEEATRAKRAAAVAEQTRDDQLRIALDNAEKRIALLARAVDLARSRQQSVARLVASGARDESQLALALIDTTRRQCDLLASQVERWKVRQRLIRLSLDGAVLQASR